MIRAMVTVPRIAFGGLLVAAMATAAAAQVREETFPMEAPVKFTRLGLEDGLPQLHIRTIAQDKLGFLWLGTDDGLVRYDGYEMTVFKSDPKEEGSLPSSSMFEIESDDDVLWLATAGGLARYEIANQRFVRMTDVVPDPLLSIEVDSQGRLWAASNTAGVTIYNPDDGSTNPVLEKVTVKVLTRAKDGGMWVGTDGAGALLVDAGGRIQRSFTMEEHGIGGNVVNDILVDEDTVWIGADGGLTRLVPGTSEIGTFTADPTKSTSLSDPTVTRLLKDASGRLWVGTHKGLNLFDAEEATFVHFTTSQVNPHSLSNPQVTSLFQDRSGVMWIGTFARGVNKFDNLALTFGYHHMVKFPMSFYLDRSGILWVATQYAGLLAYDRNAQQVTRYTHLTVDEEQIDLRELWMMNVVRAADGTIWFGSRSSGLFAFDPETETTVRYTTESSELTSNSVFSLALGRDGKLWIGTWGGGLCRLDPETGVFDHWGSREGRGLTSNYIYTLLLDRKRRGVLWIGTGDGGVNLLNAGANAVRPFWNDPEAPPKDAFKLSSNAIQSIYQSDDGSLWLGTQKGLNRLDPSSGKVTRYGAEQGLPTPSVYGVLGDDRGRIWMSTNGAGLIMFEPESGRVTTFTSADGIQANEFSFESFHKTPAGDLLFGGFDGFNWFDPEAITVDDFAPPVVLTSFEISNQEVDLGQPVSTAPGVSLGYDDEVFSFAFSALSFAAPDRVRYKYKLEGFDSDWVETDRNFVTYTNLDGGDYTFHVRAANRHGVWGEKTASIAVNVGVPPWLSWWAYLIYGLIVAIIILAYVLYQRQKLRAARQEVRLAEQQTLITAIERDIALTGAMQTGFLPRQNTYTNGRFRVFGFYRPADICSGDWWWYEPQPQGGRHEILVGDVTGHGPGPAMVTAAAATAFRVQNRGAPSGIVHRLSVLNEEVLRVSDGQYQMTMSAVELDDATGRYMFYSAGGLPVMCLPHAGPAKVVPCRGTPLGTTNFSAGQVEGAMEPGSRMMLYTDGLTEIVIRRGRLLGMRRLAQIFEGTRGMPLDHAAQTIIQQLETAAEGNPQHDDWTFTLIDWG